MLRPGVCLGFPNQILGPAVEIRFHVGPCFYVGPCSYVGPTFPSVFLTASLRIDRLESRSHTLSPQAPRPARAGVTFGLLGRSRILGRRGLAGRVALCVRLRGVGGKRWFRVGFGHGVGRVVDLVLDPGHPALELDDGLTNRAGYVGEALSEEQQSDERDNARFRPSRGVRKTPSNAMGDDGNVAINNGINSLPSIGFAGWRTGKSPCAQRARRDILTNRLTCHPAPANFLSAIQL
jgi:hypothetical protein